MLHFIRLGDFVGYFRHLNIGSYNQQQVLKLQTQNMQEKAVKMICLSYRRIGMQFLLDTLQLDSVKDVQQILEKLCEQGYTTAQTAVNNLNFQITQHFFEGLHLQNGDKEEQRFSDIILIFKQ
eukprot:TRINITY_DN109810_c0_g1_i1.p2 TRINITY_DN109810_c0_g1~~TRINITY_DN109810_c0_g1_i1.p2  ORF type:complete len:130 (+),score=10.86 TRINITY_DN109810_c0_g1_i1:22-390(+)